MEKPDVSQLVVVQKAQISKIENNVKDVRISTIVRVFQALKTKVKMCIEFDKDTRMELVG